LAVLLLGAGFGSLEGGEETARTCDSEVLSRLAKGDSAGALRLLDRVLELDPDHGLSLIERGRLNLNSGNLEQARSDFNRALFSESNEIKLQARIGLGDTFRRMPSRNINAVIEYRLALKIDPASHEALYALAQTGFALAETGGYWLASETLSELICLDPGYRDAYTLWREKIRDHTADELHTVGRCLEDYLAGHPEKSAWWLDLAQDRFHLGEVERALEALDKLKKADPRYKGSERLLLEARCLLDSGDTLGFETSYASALKEAEKYGGFTRLSLDVQPIFTPQEREKWNGLKSPTVCAALFREFWKRRDPDPISFHNERLVIHYLRLREAETYYSQLFPHSRFQTSPNYFRLLSPSSTAGDYDPEIFWSLNRFFNLDQRGFLFLRHGPPDWISRPDIDKAKNPMETWYYGSAFFTFERPFGAGDFLFVPVFLEGAGNIKKAMETESFADPLPAFSQDFYGADFQGPGGQLEVEFYQSVPFEAAPQEIPLKAAAGIYDSTWLEVALDTSSSKIVWSGTDSLWIAVNRVVVKPGRFYYAVRMDIPGQRAVSRKSLALKAYSDDKLDLSGVILGIPPAPGQQVHRRGGVDLLPRPSLTFRPGETITVYFEVYGLKKGRDGERSFRERVTVSVVEDISEKVSYVFDLLKWWGKKQPKSLTLTFERQPDEISGPVAEHFEIDTSELAPGNYRLLLEVQDNSSGDKREVTWFFDLEAAE